MDPKLELQELKAFLAENEQFFDLGRLKRYITLELLIEAEDQRVNEIQLLSKIKLEQVNDINKVRFEINKLKNDENIGQEYPWSKIELELESEIKNELLIKRKKWVILFFFFRFFILLKDPIIKKLILDSRLSFELLLERDYKLEALIIENYLSFNLFDLNVYLNKLKQLQTVLTEVRQQFILLDSQNKRRHLNKNILHYPKFFNRLKRNGRKRVSVNITEWRSNQGFINTTNFFSNLKILKKKTKTTKLLADKQLIVNILKCATLTKPHLKTRKTLNKIYSWIKKKRVINLIIFLFKQLLFRRRLLWGDIIKSMKKYEWFLIGKDYKIYRRKFGWTFKSQVKKYYKRNWGKKQIQQLNPKYIKCIELYFTRDLKNQFKRVLRKIYYINTYLHYFYYKFYKQFQKYQDQLADKHFVIPYKNKTLTFEETLYNIEHGTPRERRKIFKIILLINKHKYEKYILRGYQKRFQPSLEPFIDKLEKERYYPKANKTKFSPRVTKWLNKYINEELIKEHRESFSRPRVILEKREKEVEETYPYLPRDPLLFERDLVTADFKTKKPVKYKIIKLTKPKIALQSNFFKFKKSGINSITKNLLYTKFNSKINVPIRVQRIYKSCIKYYKNFYQDNSYSSYKNFFQRLKILYLYKPHLIKKKSFVITYLLSLMYKPIIDGITEEQTYAKRLQVFLNNFLIRIRTFKRYHLAQSIYRFTKGYILPKPEKLRFIKKLIHNTQDIRNKRPNYRAMRYMYRRSLKRLTIRIRSNIGAVRGTMPLFKYNLIATDICSPMNLKKRFKNKEYHYLFQPDINAKVKSKYRSYTSALKRNYSFSITYHTNARFYYFSPYNLFQKGLSKVILPEEDSIEKYLALLSKKNIRLND